MHWEDPEGWDGEGGGRGDRDGEHMQIHVNVWQKPLQDCKVIRLQLINIDEKRKIKIKKRVNYSTRQVSCHISLFQG